MAIYNMLAICLLLFLCLPETFQAQVSVSWAGQYDLNQYDFYHVFSRSKHTMFIDKDQNLVTGGTFTGSTDFDFSAVDATLHSLSNQHSTFITKASNTTGLPHWVCSFSYSEFADCAIDSKNNIIVTGYFYSSVDFDPGPGTYVLQGAGTRTLYVVKLTPNGEFIWAKKMDAFGALFPTCIALDKHDNILLGGSFDDSLDLNPDPILKDIHYGHGDLDNYLVKLNKNGEYIWGFTMSDVNIGQEWLNDIAIDTNNNIYSVGSFHNAMDFDPGPPAHILTSSGWQDLFIQKLDSNGTFQWVHSFGGAWSDFNPMIKIDHNQDILMAGYLAGSVDINPSQSGIDSVGTASSDFDSFISKYDPNGNYLWGQNLGESTIERIEDFIIDSMNNIYITGYFRDSSDLVYGPDSIIVHPNNIADAYIIKLAPNGDFQSHDIITASSECYGKSLAIDTSGSLYFLGFFVGTMDFPNGYASISTSGDTNSCILKLGPWINNTNSIVDEEKLQFSVFPTPTNDVLTIRFNAPIIGEELSYSIINLQGQILFQKKGNNQVEQLQLKDLPQGLYYIRIEQGKEVYQRGIIKN